MNRLPLLALLIVLTLSLTPQKAHASWVSHWLGLDHHTSKPTPTPTPIVQTIYAPPTTITIIQSYAPLPTVSYQPTTAPTTAPIAYYSPIATSQNYQNNSNSSKNNTLPVTGPESNVMILLALAAVSFLSAKYFFAYSSFRKSVRSVDIR